MPSLLATAGLVVTFVASRLLIRAVDDDDDDDDETDETCVVTLFGVAAVDVAVIDVDGPAAEVDDKADAVDDFSIVGLADGDGDDIVDDDDDVDLLTVVGSTLITSFCSVLTSACCTCPCCVCVT